MKRFFSLMRLRVAAVFTSGRKDDRGEPDVIPVDEVALSKAEHVLEVESAERPMAAIMPEKVYEVSVGNYFYGDGTHSAVKDVAKTVVGIVFWQDPDDPAKGKIVSLDELEKSRWDVAKAWESAHALPVDMTWGLPDLEELQYLYCAYNGVEPSTWGGYWEPGANPPAANSEANAVFDAKLETPFVSTGFPFYWASESSITTAGIVSFNDGITANNFVKNDACYTRNVASF